MKRIIMVLMCTLMLSNSPLVTSEIILAGSENYVTADDFIDSLKGSTNFLQENEVTNRINNRLNKITTPIVQILTYAVTILLVLRIVLDLLFITIPFSRKFLISNTTPPLKNMGNMGNPSNPINQGNNPTPMMVQQPVVSNKIQLISKAAMNAVAAENSPDGKAGTPLKIYAKDMVVILVVTPILLILAVTGALMHVGFMIGDGIANILYYLGNMI